MNIEEIVERVIHSNDDLPLAEQVAIMEQVTALLQDYSDALKAANWQAFLEPGCEVLVTASFTRPAGVPCKFLGFIAKGTPVKDDRAYSCDYLAFGYDPENPLLLVRPDKWYLQVKRIG